MISSVVEKSRFQSFFKYFSQEATFTSAQQVEIKPDKYRMTGQTSTVQAPCHSANTSSRRLKRKKFPPTSCPKRVLQLLIPKRSPSEPEGGGEVIRFLGSVQVMERKGTAGECVCVCACVWGSNGLPNMERGDDQTWKCVNWKKLFWFFIALSWCWTCFMLSTKQKKMKKRGCSNHITSWATQDTEVAFWFEVGTEKKHI